MTVETPDFDFPEHGDTVLDLTDSGRGEGIVFSLRERKGKSGPLLMIRWESGATSYRDPADVEIVNKRKGYA